MAEKLKVEHSLDWLDRIVEWGCQILHLTKHQEILKQLARFVLVGVITTLIDWSIYAVLCYVVLMNPLIAQLFSFTISTLASFYMNVIWVFNVTKGKTKQRLIVEFFIFSAIALGISTGLLSIFIYICGLNDMLAKIITTVVTMTFNYITRKMFLEEKKAKA